MAAYGAIGRERRRADQLGQFRRWPAAEEIHLEEPILRMREAQGARHVLPAAAPNSRHAEGIALDRHRSR